MENMEKTIALNIKSEAIDNKQHVNFDLSEMLLLLQILGFTINTLNFETALETELLEESEPGTLNIDVSCIKSGLKARLAKPLDACKCPSNDDTNKLQFWSITNNSTDKILSSDSSIIPNVSSNNKKVIFDHLQKVLNIISNSNKVLNEKIEMEEKHEVKTEVLLNILEPVVMEGKISKIEEPAEQLAKITKVEMGACLVPADTWEVDPSTSPPQLTSSPLTNVTGSSKHSSISNENKCDLLDVFLNIQKLVEKGKDLVNSKKNSTFTKQVPIKKRVSDIRVSPLAMQNAVIAGDFIQMNLTHTQERSVLNSTPKKLLLPKKTIATTGDKPKNLQAPSRIRMIYKKTLKTDAATTPTNSKNTSIHRNDTPRPVLKLNSNGIKLSTSTTTTTPTTLRYKFKRPATATTPTGENMPVGLSKLKHPSKLAAPIQKK